MRASIVPDECVCVEAAVAQVTGNTLLNLPQASPCSLCHCVNAPRKCVCVCVWGRQTLAKQRKCSKEAGAEMPRPTLSANDADPCHHQASLLPSCFFFLLSRSRSLAPYITHHLPGCTHTHIHIHLQQFVIHDAAWRESLCQSVLVH